MNAEKMRLQLETFYRETFTKALKIRKAKKNVILYTAKPEHKVIARFNASTDDDAMMAVGLAEVCRAAYLNHLVRREMDKLEEKAVDVDHPITEVPVVPKKELVLDRNGINAQVSLVQGVNTGKDPLSLFLGQ